MPYKCKVLHIFNDQKFSIGFFEFLLSHDVNLKGHLVFHYRCTKSNLNRFGIPGISAANFLSPIANLRMLKPLFQSEKIIIHCLASPVLLLYLIAFPSLARKTYWVIWGKDLYFYKTLIKKRTYHKIYEFFRKKAIRNIQKIITYNDGDFELAEKWYGCKAKQYRSFMYPSNLYKDIRRNEAGYTDKSTVILVGNSADPSNNHLDAFSLLQKYSSNNIEIIVPLSYGDNVYAKEITRFGFQIFGEKFRPIENLLPLDEYNNLLGRVDIAVFAHKRQQAMGNIITLVGLGVKVHIRNDITTWKFLQKLGITTNNLFDLNLEPLDETIKAKNMSIISTTFSEENLLKQLNEIIMSS